MRIRPTAPRHAVSGLAAALVLCLAAAPALASPGEGFDPVLQLLADKGLLVEPSAATGTATAAGPDVALAAEAPSAPKTSLLRQMHDRASELTTAAMDLV